MYARRPSFVFGFHGTDKAVALDILNGRTSFQHSNNSYDWLGHGVYFWENSLERARQYAEEDSRRRHSAINEPFVLGAVIDLGECLDLLDQKYLDLVRASYLRLRADLALEGRRLPSNQGFAAGDFDFKRRELDCAVIRYTHQLGATQGMRFDTVRAAFWEGEPLYEGAGFRRQNHIQVAVVNPACIKGVFLPREHLD
jgi:hypothetical protein